MKKLNLIYLLLIAQTAFSQQDEMFYFPVKEWKEVTDVNFEEYTFFTESDSLNTILIKPTMPPNATVLYFHGAGGNVTSYLPYVKPLTRAGFQVLLVDFRGYGKSSGTPTHINIAHDAQFIFEEMNKMSNFNQLEIIIYGSSMGTQVATKLAADNQEEIAALILDGTISSFVDIALQHAPLSAHEGIKSMAKLFPYSAQKDVQRIKEVPILFIHSKEDKEVNFKQAQKVYDATTAPKILWIYEGDHLQAPVLLPEQFIAQVEKLLKW